MDIDKAIHETAYILDCIATLKSIQESGSCEDCGKPTCYYRAKVGEPMRYNCMFHEMRINDIT